MSTRFIKYYAISLSLLIAAGGFILYKVLPDPIKPSPVKNDQYIWYPPGLNTLLNNPEAELILYGKELILNTSAYLGPKGSVARMGNGMNCGNCHLDAGTRMNGNSFAAVAANYPKYRNRSGRMESIEFRINECMARSLNGEKLDSLNREMRAMVAYLKWLGEDVPQNIIPKGSGVPKIPILNRTADPVLGRLVFLNKCTKCHGSDGQGVRNPNSGGFTYPPLWGNDSYNVSAGMYRISSLAAFAKYNMPYTAIQENPQLSDQEAWDVAAFICSQPRPVKFFKEDWPHIETKPYDHPFGPYADTFSELQHKYGPFVTMINKKQGN